MFVENNVKFGTFCTKMYNFLKTTITIKLHQVFKVNLSPVMIKSHENKKTKKCQPAAGDTPDLIQTECVTDSGLARQKKLTERKKYKIQTKKMNLKLHLPPVMIKSHENKKTKKCQPAAGDTPDLIQTECVTDSGLARQKKLTERKKYKIHTKKMNLKSHLSPVMIKSHENKKTKKCQPAAGDTPDLIQTECVTDSGLARQKKLTERKKYKTQTNKMNLIKLIRKKLIVWLCISLLSLDPCTYTGSHLVQPCSSVIISDNTVHRSVDINSVTISEGTMDTPLLKNGKMISWKSRKFLISSKILNRLKKSENGNGKWTNIKILHWNAGSRHWNNKIVEMETLLLEKKPDLCFISEANLWDYLEEEERYVQGYRIILPKTMDRCGHARIALLAREGLNVHLMEEYMESDTAAIWIKIGTTKKSQIAIGGIYRQHRILGVTDKDATWLEIQSEQEERWSRIVDKWQNISNKMKCVVIGDLNLDNNRWANPEPMQEVMVDLVKDKIEAAGSIQLIEGITRSWRDQMDSRLDHVWTNCDQRTVNVTNEVRGASDHNLIGIELSLKELKVGGQNVLRRTWKNFSVNECLDKVRKTVWNDILLETNVDIANSAFEDRLCAIIDSMAPMKVLQIRTKYHSWISESTKTAMKDRDLARETAKATGLDDDWSKYRSKRNLCTAKQRRDKSKYHSELYSEIEAAKDTAKLFGKTKELLGWQQSGPPSGFLINGKILRKQKDIAEAQAVYYENKILKIKNSFPRVNFDPMHVLKKHFNRWQPIGGRPQFVLKSTNSSEVLNMIKKLKPSHAFGRDKIDGATLKIVGPHIIEVITHVINLSLGTSRFPAKWKISRIIPILKSKELD